MMAVKALLLGISYEQVAALYAVPEKTLSRWVGRFNGRGIDGLIEGRHTGRPHKITPEQSSVYEELIQHPERVDQTHWTGKKFHGYLTKKLDREIGYRTVVRWLHDKGFRLKVPRSWPDGQDEEKADERRCDDEESAISKCHGRSYENRNWPTMCCRVCAVPRSVEAELATS